MLDDMEFQNKLDEMEKKGPTAVAVFTAREVHEICKRCQAHEVILTNHTNQLKALNNMHLSTKETIISGAGGGSATAIVLTAIYFIGKLLHLWT